ncbi:MULTISPECIES: hypothetical protein [unclassified Moraxella]|uniref:hypothetical protein n=1 Tax=unclassified Moraxella TaxID=2685852 RepID=UPI002B402AB1|nr:MULTISPECIES: hypothetical protein [unclassified Moraxella]
MITLASVSLSLQTPFDNKRAVMLANAWLKQHRLVEFDDVPDDVLMAGALIAEAVADGDMYQGRSEGVVVSKSVKAGEVSTAKTYASGADGMAISANEQMALALIKPYLQKFETQVMVRRY